jgi:hypothetical protein
MTLPGREADTDSAPDGIAYPRTGARRTDAAGTRDA